MGQNQSMTKLCIAPWLELELNVHGNIRPCSGPIDGDYGNINDAISDPEKFRDVFNNDAFIQLRRQLLTGQLQPECETCRIVENRKVRTEDLRKHVVSYLKSRGRYIPENADLACEAFVYNCSVGITNKCMLACKYCFFHSNDKPGDGIRLYDEIDPDRFLQQIAMLVDNGLRELSICGAGEPTIHPSWVNILTTIFDRYPALNVYIVSNFMKKFSDEELDLFLRFKRISISCDTLDPELFFWLRPWGKVNILLENIRRLKAKMATTTRPKPLLILNATESNVILGKIEELAKYAVDNDIGLQFSNLLVVPGSYAEKNKCITKIAEIPDEQVPAAWELLCDLPGRIAAQRPGLHLHLGPMYQVLKERVEASTLNRFVPTAEELFYRSFALSNPKNPNAFLRKLYSSFNDCLRGILFTSGSTIDMELPCRAARLRYRTIRLEIVDNKMQNSFGEPRESAVGSHLRLVTGSTQRTDTYVFLEVISYEADDQIKQVDEVIILSQPRPAIERDCPVGESRGVCPGPASEIAGVVPATLSVQSAPAGFVGSADFLNEHGELELKKGHNYHARTCFKLAVAIDPAHAAAHSNLGMIQWREGEREEALRSIRSALDLKPTDFRVLRNCYKTLTAAGEFEAAIGPLKSYLQRKPYDDAGWDDYAALVRRTCEESAGV